jgi:DNA polymerase type B, organellar and viral
MTNQNVSLFPKSSHNISSKWTDAYYPVSGLITNLEISKSFLKLINIIKESQKDDNRILLVQFKVGNTTNNTFRNITNIQNLKLKNYKELLKFLIEEWNKKDDEYSTLTWDIILFSYKFLPKGSTLKNQKESFTSKKTLDEDKVLYIPIGGYKLPNTADYRTWGDFITESKDLIIIQSPVLEVNYFIKPISLTETKVEARSRRDQSKIFYTFIDKILTQTELAKLIRQTELSVSSNSFVRTLNNTVFTYINGEVMFKQRTYTQSPILKSILKSPRLNENFLTMDLETRTINNIMTPICISIYGAKESFSVLLTNYNSVDEMIKTSLTYLMHRKYSGYRVYLHNFSNFDSTFLINALSDLGTLKPIIKDGKVMDIKFNFNKKDYIYFRDSYLLLPASLRALAIAFNVENKGIFPYRFVNKPDMSLGYSGPVPGYEYFDKITKTEYKSYCETFKGIHWNLRKELIKYCEQDCRVLYQIIDIFYKKIFEQFRVDIHNYPTLPSLAFAIFRSNFLDKVINGIPLITGEIYKYIKASYTGGAVDVYKPHGKDVKAYDVNSLYPAQMHSNDMPVGVPTFFQGDIKYYSGSLGPIEDLLGFYEVEVTSPEGLVYPILQRRVKTTKGGTRTVADLGTWTGVYFSEEIKNAEQYGYTFKVLSGYLFKKENIFKEYVDTLYELKKNSISNSPDYLIAKMLLNSLYGKFGQKPELEKHLIINKDDLLKYETDGKYVLTNSIHLNNGKELISFFELNEFLGENYSSKYKNISVPIASAVTAYARIEMSHYKMMCLEKGITVYYSDTDSIYISAYLDPKYVGKELGQMKLERVFKEACFIAPKVYGGITIEDKEYIKVKGLKNPVSFEELKSLLIKDTKLEFNQEKWHKSIPTSNITIKNESYTLVPTDNKRKLIYDNNGIFINTEPLTFNIKQ